MAVRNPGLFNALKGLFKTVKVANEGEPLIIKQRQSVTGKSQPWKEQGGEEYRVCCPFCGDSRFRLYINHAWGLDTISKYPASKLVVCHNEHCEKNDDKDAACHNNPVLYLKRNLRAYFSDVKFGLNTRIAPQAEEVETVPLPFPEKEWCQQLTDLNEKHPAVGYWLKRKFDLEVLETRWGAVYAEQYPVKRGKKDYSWLGGRVFIPTGTGWQARAVTETERLKYFSCPGWKKSQCVYNLEEARRHQFAVIVEGVTDTWRIGSPSVAIFGKSISDHQAKLIGDNFSTVALLLDPDAYEGKENAGQKSLNTLRRRVSNVFKVTLPDGRKDAAMCTHDTVWKCIERAAAAANLAVLRPEHSDALFNGGANV